MLGWPAAKWRSLVQLQVLKIAGAPRVLSRIIHANDNTLTRHLGRERNSKLTPSTLVVSQRQRDQPIVRWTRSRRSKAGNQDARRVRTPGDPVHREYFLHLAAGLKSRSCCRICQTKGCTRDESGSHDLAESNCWKKSYLLGGLTQRARSLRLLLCQGRGAQAKSVRAEPVEGCAQHGAGFDRLSPDGVGGG